MKYFIQRQKPYDYSSNLHLAALFELDGDKAME